jgi:hypothetical protein
MWLVVIAVVVIAVVVVALIGDAFRPRRRGISDGDARRSQAITQGRVQPYSPPDLPRPGGM